MDLHELLFYIDFDYEVENNEIKLIDCQGVYLGDIADFRVNLKLPAKDIVAYIIDRTEIYWNDYVVTPLIEDIGCSEELSWTELYDYASKYYGEKRVYKNSVLGYLLNPESVEVEEKNGSYNSRKAD